MRSIDVAKCWSFGGDGKEKKKKEETEKFLLSLMCSKYQWWKDELELVRSKAAPTRVIVPSLSPPPWMENL
uniref:Uncharacterized protein n=1 Tax=Nelumbo nucifera TaxID=4432 RepID=A0A822Z0B6_NELNU|nr:TPA_asm: hypothetical protein HUJ06_007087 [Nelumbo nucifera]